MCAKSRMMNVSFTERDDFLELSNESKLLYFYIQLSADDDGFFSSPKKIIKMLGSEDAYIEELVSKGFLIPIHDRSLYVITHWNVHNHIPPTKHAETIFQEEKQHLFIDENRVYHISSEGMQNGCKTDTQIRIDKSSKDKNRIDKISKGEGSTGKRKTGESEREEGGTHIVSVTDAYHILEGIGETSVDSFHLDQYQKTHLMQILSKSDKELGEQLDILRTTLEGSKITIGDFISIIERMFD